jgi:hypothetical protein
MYFKWRHVQIYTAGDGMVIARAVEDVVAGSGQVMTKILTYLMQIISP